MRLQNARGRRACRAKRAFFMVSQFLMPQIVIGMFLAKD